LEEYNWSMGNQNSLQTEEIQIDQTVENLIKERTSPDGKVITLNIGGKPYATLKSTLTKSKFFQDLLTNDEEIIYDKENKIFLDRPPKEFSLILDGLRTGIIEMPDDKKDYENLISEIKFFKLEKQFNDLLLRGRFHGTTIINQIQQKQLNAWVNNATKDWQLIYKASKDGFQAIDFHSRCDGFSNTLVIVYGVLF
jgi:hypothetical protein